MIRIVFIFLLIVFSCRAAWSFDHSSWDRLLRDHVKVVAGGKQTLVDYDGMNNDRATLASYLEKLSEVTPDAFSLWPRSERLAFLINAYNGWTVELILRKYPGLNSIKELGSLFSSPWKKKFIPLLGTTRSLDDIEHTLIREPGIYDDFRIHFGVNCASLGCPALLWEAYTGEKLDAQLAQAEQLFLSDRTKNRYNKESSVLEVSSIFKWYSEDFSRGWCGVHSLREYFTRHHEILGLGPDRERFARGEIEIQYLKYDWSLNRSN